MEHFGGHKYAAGLSLKPENLEEFSRRFEEYVAENIDREELIPELNVDLEIDFSDITPKFVRVLKQFAPFGPGNMAPVFLSRNVVDNGTSRSVGNKKHLKLFRTDIGTLVEVNDSNYLALGFNNPLVYNQVRFETLLKDILQKCDQTRSTN